MESYKYNHLKANASNLKEASANIKKHLAKEFPGIKFSLKTTSSTLSSSLHITYTDGPVSEQVEMVVKIFEYDHKGSDIMTDYFESLPTEFTTIYGGWDYIHITRKMSEQTRDEILEEVKKELGESGAFYEREITRNDFLVSTNIPAGVMKKYLLD